ncbi:MAG TPA: alpha/beta hydrolase [Caulobacteraceae bacterium]
MGSRIARRTALGMLASTGALLGPAGGNAQALRPSLPATVIPKAWTDAEVLPLWPRDAPGAADFRPIPPPDNSPPVFLRNTAKPSLHLFRPPHPNGSALLVIPGGGYEFVSIANEGVDVAAKTNPLGYTVFVLNYRLPAEGWRDGAIVPLQDAQRAMRVIRASAARFMIDPARLSVVGFSAGGHLAASLATGFAEAAYVPSDDADRIDARPAAAGLIYPVITMTHPFTHEGSRQHLLGNSPSDQIVAARSPEQHVGPDTPPTFLAHACDDPAVPVENSLMMMAALRAARRPVEAHFFQRGGHAFGVGFPGTPTQEWIPLFDLWLRNTLGPS